MLDITERKQAEETLKKSEQDYKQLYRQFQGLLNAIPDTIMLISPDLTIVWANRGAMSKFADYKSLQKRHCFSVWEGEYFPLGVDRPNHHNCRFVVATNLDLEQRVAAGMFRKDLFYRLKAHRVHLPPLRERREDIPLLLNHFVEEAAHSLGKVTPTLTPQLQVLLATYHFPGNVRELRAMVYDALTQHRGHTLSMASFKTTMDKGSDPLRNQGTDSVICPVAAAMLTVGPQLPTLEESATLLVYEALERSKNNQTIAARLLGITRQALNQRVKKLKESSSLSQI